MVLYAVLTLSQVSALRDLRGGDKARLAALTIEFGVRLMQVRDHTRLHLEIVCAGICA